MPVNQSSLTSDGVGLWSQSSEIEVLEDEENKSLFSQVHSVEKPKTMPPADRPRCKESEKGADCTIGHSLNSPKLQFRINFNH